MDDQPDFAELEARHRRLMERVASAPIVELVGLVGASPPGGARTPPETLWTLLITLEAWRTDSGEMRARPMTARLTVTESELDAWRQSIRPYSVLRARARVIDDPQFVRAEAKMEEILSVDVFDEQLTEYARRLQEPVEHVDPLLGALVLDRRLESYRGSAIWTGRRVTIDVVCDSSDLKSGLSTLRRLWNDQEAWYARITQFAVQRLLPLKNESWLDEDEAPLTPEQFKSKMQLECISVDGHSFAFLHGDGDMFWGHAIEICGDVEAGPTSADIPG